MIITCLLCFLISLGRNDWFQPPILLSSGTTVIDSIPANANDVNVHVRLGRKSNKKIQWEMHWCQKDKENYIVAVVTLPDIVGYDDIYLSQIEIEVKRVVNGIEQIVFADQFPSNEEYLSLKLIYDGYSARLYAGSKEKYDLGVVPFESDISSNVSVVLSQPMFAQRLTVQCTGSRPPVYSAGQYLESTDLICGRWKYLDRELNATMADLGGKYGIEIRCIESDIFEIIYIDGASIKQEKWNSPRLKGILKSTQFQNNYDLIWYDANGNVLEDDNNAQISEDGSILTLKFPIFKSQLRFSRLY